MQRLVYEVINPRLSEYEQAGVRLDIQRWEQTAPQRITEGGVNQLFVANRRDSPAFDYADAATRPMIATAALSGLRQSELLALRWQDVEFEAGVIRVRYQLSRGSADAPGDTRAA